MAQLVAFVRGINLGAHKRVAMPELRSKLEQLGFEDVRTHLQSGNVVLKSGDSAAQVERAVATVIADSFGFDVEVIVRTARQLADVVKADPLGKVAKDPKLYPVAFLSAKPKAAALREVAAEDFAPERFDARGRELYVWCPNGQQKSPLLKALGKKQLGVTVTVRNWNTVTKVAEML